MKNDYFSKLIKSITASSIASVVCSPIDVVCVQRQVQKVNIQNISSSFRVIYQKQGFRGFYKGLTANIAARGLFYSGFFPLYDLFHEQNYSPFISGYISSNIMSLIANPFYVAKVRSQTEVITDISAKKRNVLQIISKIARTEGIRGLTSGYLITALKNTEVSLQMSLIELFKLYTSPVYASLYPIIVFFAKFISVVVTYPLETIRTNQRNIQNSTIITTFRRIIYTDGFKGLYRGFGVYCFKSIPTSVITFSLYEVFKRYSL